MKISLIAVAALATALSTPAAAADLGWESQGAFSVRVTIGPIGVALKAAQDGADGLWTIKGDQGLMINAPTVIGAGETGEMSLYAAYAQGLVVTSLSQDLKVSRFGTAQEGGLHRAVFTLKAGDGSTATNSGTLVISTL
ncbi:MAG: hypothetical protein P0Y52_02160 [Candidatus Brevundimonas phytovorans]|nr:hypothetical protein [Brevundimonas sp.]WEK58366.1 MAG: hypothetical protein P0Y52_02160 [Brevundimonas sp.]